MVDHPLPEGADRIATACARVLASPDGVVMFDWLRSITVFNIMGAEVLNTERLIHREGQRSIIALIETLAEKARNPDATDRAGPRTGRHRNR